MKTGTLTGTLTGTWRNPQDPRLKPVGKHQNGSFYTHFGVYLHPFWSKNGLLDPLFGPGKGVLATKEGAKTTKKGHF